MQKRRSTAREYLEALLIAGIFLGFTNAFVFKTFYIPSASMEDTLLIGDHLFVNRFIFGAEGSSLSKLFPLRRVDRGDVVVFRSPERPAVDMVKRCIGVPGDTIRITGKTLFVNGEAIDESGFAVHRDRVRARGSLRKRDEFGPYVVPPDSYFCMGDNRDHSYDSRFWGPVPAHFVKGRAFLIYWSFGGQTPDGSWPGWGARIRQLGQTAASFFTKTRWTRTLHLIR